MNSLFLIALIENPSTMASFVISSSRVSFLMKKVNVWYWPMLMQRRQQLGALLILLQTSQYHACF